MAMLIQGRIAYAKKPTPDPQGNNPKKGRPFVIITHNDDIKDADIVQGVAITTELTLSPPDHYYRLPSGGRHKHGCIEGSSALCTWIENLDRQDLDWEKGKFLEPVAVRAIIIKVKELKPGKFLSRAPGEQSPPQ